MEKTIMDKIDLKEWRRLPRRDTALSFANNLQRFALDFFILLDDYEELYKELPNALHSWRADVIRKSGALSGRMNGNPVHALSPDAEELILQEHRETLVGLLDTQQIQTWYADDKKRPILLRNMKALSHCFDALIGQINSLHTQNLEPSGVAAKSRLKGEQVQDYIERTHMMLAQAVRLRADFAGEPSPVVLAAMCRNGYMTKDILAGDFRHCAPDTTLMMFADPGIPLETRRM